MRRTLLLRIGAGVAAACLSAGLLAGCTSEAGNTSAATMMADAAGAAEADDVAGQPDRAGDLQEAPAPDDQGGSSAQGGAGGSSGEGGRDVPDVALADRQVIRTASMAFTERVAPVIDPVTGAPDPEAEAAARAAAVRQAAGRIAAITAAAGGFRGAVEGGGDSVVVTLRIPVEQYESVLAQLGELGTPERLTESTTDVTTQVVDLQSRIATMRAGVERVRALLAQAKDVGEVIAIESELTAREADLESLLGQQAALKDQVSLSTITVTVTSVTQAEPVATVAPPAEPSGFSAGLAAGWSAAKDFVVWLGAVVGALLPWLPVIAVVVVLVIWLRRRQERPTPAATQPAATQPAATQPPATQDPRPELVETGR